MDLVASDAASSGAAPPEDPQPQPAGSGSPPGSSPGAGAPSGGRGPALTQRHVPSSQIGRAFTFASMAASIAVGSVTDAVGRSLTRLTAGKGSATSNGSGASAGSGQAADGGGGDGPPAAASSSPGAAGAAASGPGGGRGSMLMTTRNAERLADALCHMRGAALKLGQMISMQDESMLPPEVQAALARVRAAADGMPRQQVEFRLTKVSSSGNRSAEASLKLLCLPLALAFASSSTGFCILRSVRCVTTDGVSKNDKLIQIRQQRRRL